MNVFEVSAALILNKNAFEQGLKEGLAEAESETANSEKRIGGSLSNVGGMFSKGILALTKATVAGIALASGAVGALVKQSVSQYAEYQQTWGGVQKLYGTAGMSIEEYAKSVGKSVDEVKGKYAELTQAQNLVLENAQDAFRTTNMSTQQYMEQATSFSAALINSLGGDTVKAAEQTDVAMRAIADNYNTFGGDMQNIQNAFQGFAKQNYTMLDNLKLGYGGTKTEMERLIADANEYAQSMGMAGDLTINSFSDIVTAIDLVQQKQGIAGTTAREATETISGSLNMLKSAWDNLVAGFADPNADISKLIDNVVTSLVGSTDEAGKHVKGFIDNIIPTIQQATEGIIKVVQGLAPIISEQLPTIVETLLPMVIETATQLFNGLVDALPDLLQVIFDQLPTIFQTIVDAVLTMLPMIIEVGASLLESLFTGIIETLPELLPRITDVILQIAEMLSDPTGLTEIIKSAMVIIQQLALGLMEALPQTIPAIVEVITSIVIALTEPTNLMRLIDAAVKIIIALADGLIQAIPVLIEAAPKIIMNLVEALILLAPQLIASGVELITQLILGIMNMKAKAVQSMAKVFTSIKDDFKERIKMAKDWGKDLIQNFIDGLLAKWEALKSTVKDIAGSIKDFLGFSEPKLGPLSNFHTYAPDMMDLFMQGIKDNKSDLLDTVADAFDFEDLIGANNAEIGYNGGSDLYSMLAELLQLLPQLANSQIVLDTGILVGETAPKMDVALGQLMTNRGRNV